MLAAHLQMKAFLRFLIVCRSQRHSIGEFQRRQREDFLRVLRRHISEDTESSHVVVSDLEESSETHEDSTSNTNIEMPSHTIEVRLINVSQMNDLWMNGWLDK